MDAQLRSMLNETEQALLRAVQPRELKRLDEDALTELHDRIRRARNKYSKLYRRARASGLPPIDRGVGRVRRTRKLPERPKDSRTRSRRSRIVSHRSPLPPPKN